MGRRLLLLALLFVLCLSACSEKTKDMEIMVQDEDSTSETVLPDGETPTDLQDTIPEQEQVEVMYSLQMDFPEEPLSPGASNGSDWMYAGDMIEVRAFPLEDAPVTHHASNMVVRVHTVVRYEDSDWALVTTPWADTMYGTMGYVRLCDLVEYTGMEEQIVCYPVKYSETAVDLETGEKLPTCSHPVWVQYMGDEQAEVYWEGGEAHRISRSTVLKPVLEDGEMIFPDPNITEETETVHQSEDSLVMYCPAEETDSGFVASENFAYDLEFFFCLPGVGNYGFWIAPEGSDEWVPLRMDNSAGSCEYARNRKIELMMIKYQFNFESETNGMYKIRKVKAFPADGEVLDEWRNIPILDRNTLIYAFKKDICVYPCLDGEQTKHVMIVSKMTFCEECPNEWWKYAND